MQGSQLVMIQAKRVYEKTKDATIFKLLLPWFLILCRRIDLRKFEWEGEGGSNL